MEISKTLHVTDRKDWRKWLREHYKTEKEIWLVYYKKATGKPRIEYNDAVEEALCDADYWADNLRRPVQFHTAIGLALAQGERTFIEVSPHPLLTTAIQEIARSVLVISLSKHQEMQHRAIRGEPGAVLFVKRFVSAG